MRGYLTLISLLFCVPTFGQSEFYQASYQQGTPSGGVPVIETNSINSYDSNSTDCVCDKPTGVAVDDLMLAYVVNDGPDPAGAEYDATSDPAGWTFLRNEGDAASDSSIGVFWKIAVTADLSTSNYTFTSVGSFDRSCGILRISGVDTTTPIGVSGTFTSTTGTTDDIPGITTVNANSLVIGFLAGDGADTAPFSISGTGWSEVAEIVSASTGNDGNSAVWASKEMATAGATGDPTVTMNSNDGMGSFMISINPQ